MAPTPRTKVRVVTLQIDEQDVSAREDESIIDVAREHGIEIPSLCYLDGLSVWGACRLCLVQLEGNPRLVAACSTKVAEGMRVRTNSATLQEYRKLILEMLFAERNHVCSVCVSNGHCELQDLAQKCGVDHVRVPYRNAPYGVDSSHDLFRVDHNRCILCTRCVRVCDEIEGAHTWDVMGRGIDCQVITDMNRPWGESESCTSFGAVRAAEYASQKAGLYRAAQTFAFVPYQLLLSMTFIVFPLISRATSTGNDEEARAAVRQALRASLVLVIAVAAPIAGAADGVMLIAYPKTYLPASAALAVLVFGIALFALFVITATMLTSAGRPYLAAGIAAASLAGLMIAVRLSVVAVGHGGDPLRATAVGTAAAAACALAFSCVAVRVYLGALVAIPTVVRTLAAGASAAAVAYVLPHQSRWTALLALAGSFLSYWIVLGLLREFGIAEIEALRQGLLHRRRR